MQTLRSGVSWAGLLSGPLAWTVSTQLNYALAPQDCGWEGRIIPLVALALAVLALAGGLLSWRAHQTGGAAFKPERESHTERFVAMLGMASAALFALVIAMQGAAGLILTGCER